MRWFGWFRRRPTAVEAEKTASGSTMVIGGRERVVGIPYMLPRDLEELNRLDFQHYMLRYALHGNYAAPVTNPTAILDVGTGTGRWALEMAPLFPAAQVVGLDVVEPPVDERANTAGLDTRPPNYRFVPGNILEGLPFPDASFDLVHMRLLVAALPPDRWPFVVQELVRVTRLGGWVESVEGTPPVGGGPALDLLVAQTAQVMARRGVDFADGTRVGDRLSAAGLANIQTRRIDLPCGASGGRIGELVAADYIAVAKGFGGMLVSQGAVSAEQLDELLRQMELDLASPQTHCVAPYYIAFGQRVA